MKKSPNTLFRFDLTAADAQTIFNMCDCLLDERQLVADIWRSKKDRARIRKAFRRFQRQLDRQYNETGVEV